MAFVFDVCLSVPGFRKINLFGDPLLKVNEIRFGVFNMYVFPNLVAYRYKEFLAAGLRLDDAWLAQNAPIVREQKKKAYKRALAEERRARINWARFHQEELEKLRARADDLTWENKDLKLTLKNVLQIQGENSSHD